MSNHAAYLIDDILNSISNNLNVMMIGEIKGYNNETKLAEVIPLHYVPNQNIEYQPLVNVSIAYFSIGGYRIRIKPKIGDKLLIIFADYDLSNIKINGTTKEQKTNRTHALEDAIVLPLSINFINDDFETTEDLIIEKEGTETYIKIAQNGVIVLNASKIVCGEGATQQVQLYGGGASTVLYTK